MPDLGERWKRWLERTGYDGGVDSPPMLVLHRMETDAARITALETALAEARNAALEEAAKVADDNRTDDDSMWDRAAQTIAQAIRDMKDRT